MIWVLNIIQFFLKFIYFVNRNVIICVVTTGGAIQFTTYFTQYTTIERTEISQISSRHSQLHFEPKFLGVGPNLSLQWALLVTHFTFLEHGMTPL